MGDKKNPAASGNWRRGEVGHQSRSILSGKRPGVSNRPYGDSSHGDCQASLSNDDSSLTELHCLTSFSPLVFTFQRLCAEFVYSVQTSAQWEVCLKHRNNRREKIPAGVTPGNRSGVAAVFVLFVANDAAACHGSMYIDALVACGPRHAKFNPCGHRLTRRMPGCQSGDAGASPADRTGGCSPGDPRQGSPAIFIAGRLRTREVS